MTSRALPIHLGVYDNTNRKFPVETLCRYGHDASRLEKAGRLTDYSWKVTCHSCRRVLGSRDGDSQIL